MDSNLINNKVIVKIIDSEDKQYITEISLNLTNLDYLSLDDNQLTEAKEKAFFGLNNLKKLNLSSNQLKEIKEK